GRVVWATGRARSAHEFGPIALRQLEDFGESERQVARRLALVRLELANGVRRAAGSIGDRRLTQVQVAPQRSDALAERHIAPRPLRPRGCTTFWGGRVPLACRLCPSPGPFWAAKGSRHMHRSSRSFVASLAIAACLWPAAAAHAQEAPGAGLSVDQARSAFSSAGYQVDTAYSWDWTSPPVTSFQ